jgi:acetate kinase
MGTRCGDIDPGLLSHLARNGLSMKEIDKMMNKSSGLLGLAGHNDWRTVSELAEQGHERCQLAAGVRTPTQLVIQLQFNSSASYVE